MVGILLPPSVPGALVNFAALLSGKVPVNLNYTARDDVHRLVRRSSAASRRSSPRRRSSTKVKLERARRRRSCSKTWPRARLHGEKLAALRCWRGSCPRGCSSARSAEAQRSRARRSGHGHLLQRQHRRAQGRDAHALQHRGERRAIGQAFALDRRDRLLGILPFFHSFGYTATLGAAAPCSASASSTTRTRSTRTAIGELCAAIRVHVPARDADVPALYLRRVRAGATSAACGS